MNNQRSSASIARLTEFARGLFSSRVEERLELRLIVLALGWWVALSLLWVGSPAWVSVGGGVLLSAGHAFSWWFRGWASSARSAMLGVAVMGALLLVPRTVSAASGGDWLPVAHFVLLFQGLTSFELRTRGGLYTSMIPS